MKKYKIIKTPGGYSVWKLRDYGDGSAYESTRRVFRSKYEAMEYIRKEVEKYDSK